MRTILNSAIVILMTVILAGFVLLGLTGCTTENPLRPVDPVFKVHSATADGLMENFVLTYGGRDLERYAQLLHEDFIFTFCDQDVRRLGPSYQYFTREDELITARNMFCGEPIINSLGQPQAAITSIEFQVWEQMGNWVLTAEGHLCGVFDCVLVIRRDGDRDLTVAATQVFTVVMADVSDDEGSAQPNYQIIGWQELDN